MTDILALVIQLPTPIKVAWGIWLIWIVLQVMAVRLVRQASPRGEPSPLPMAEPPSSPVATRSRRRRRRRLPSHHDQGALQEIGA